MVIVMALLASFANVVASVMQRLGVENAPAASGPSLGMVRHMIQRPVWLGGLVIMFLAYCAQAVALHLGSLSIVQPLLVSEWVLLVLVLWLWYGTSLAPRDLAAAAATAIGLAVFLAVADPREGTRVPSAVMWWVLGGVVTITIVALVFLGRRGPAWWRAIALGAAASVGFSLVAAITKSLTNELMAGWGAVFGSWQVYSLALVGTGSFVIMQSAFQVGPFGASQSSLILTNPFLSIVIGALAFDESLRGGVVYRTLEVASLAVMVIGVIGLATSPLVAGVHSEDDGTHLLEGRGLLARRHTRR
ncbi:MAG TPA: DMT family transporter [Acidimicrobiales bacterium]|nr:DMT family transporter [Acidimicrobiales bacterium]